PRRQGGSGARARRRGQRPDHLLFRQVVEHAAPGRVGQPHQGADDGGDDARGNDRHGARVLVLQHRSSAHARALHHARARTRKRVGGGVRRKTRMNWASWSDFFAMGGYALYVWGSYLVALALMIT